METAGTLSSSEFGVHCFFSHFHQLISSCSCMEHSLHVAVGHILSSITPVDAEKTRKADDNDNDNDNDEFSAGAATFDNCSAMLSHALRKLLGLIVQIRKSPQAHTFFKRMCCESNIPEHDLVLFVRTRWASMFACLEQVLMLRSVCSYTRMPISCTDTCTGHNAIHATCGR